MLGNSASKHRTSNHQEELPFNHMSVLKHLLESNNILYSQFVERLTANTDIAVIAFN